MDSVRDVSSRSIVSSEEALLAAALTTCRSVLEHELAGLHEDGPRHDELESVRAHLSRFAAIAVEHDVPPERVIVMLKRIIRELPPIMPWRDAERENISHELVDMMITAYFGLDGEKS